MIIIIKEIKAQIIPAKATVVNFGVFFFHLRVTEKIENPNAEDKPNINPVKELLVTLPNAIITIPAAATIMDIHTLIVIFSFKNKKPNKAVKKGIAARHKRVIAADVFVIDHIKDIIAIPSPNPPIQPEIPILK